MLQRLWLFLIIFSSTNVHAGEFNLEIPYTHLALTENMTDTYSYNKNKVTAFKFQDSQTEKKSVGKALLYSLILPGAGEYYAGHTNQAKFFLGVELLAWGTFLFNGHYFNSLQKDYRSFARSHAQVSSDAHDKQYWINIGKFDDLYAYNEQRTRQRRVEALYEETDENLWRWDAKSNRLKYDRKRLDAIGVKDRQIYFATAILVNHLVSAINAMRLTRKYNRGLARNGFDYHLVVNTIEPRNAYVGINFQQRF